MTPVSRPIQARSARGSCKGSPSYKYAILIKPIGKLISASCDLKTIKTKLAQLHKRLSISEINYEKGVYRNHIHAVVTSPRKSLYAKKFQSKGVYVGLQLIRNIDAYRRYIKKEQEIMSIEEFYAENYGFSDSS